MTTEALNSKVPNPWWKSLPILQGLLPLERAQLGPDIIAGVTLAALGIPEVMGYTKIIGTPIIAGLYTLFLPVVVFALLGSFRHPVVSADSATAAMIAAGLAALSFLANTPRYVELTSLIALVTAESCSWPEFCARGSSPIFSQERLSLATRVGEFQEVWRTWPRQRILLIGCIEGFRSVNAEHSIFKSYAAGQPSAME